MEKEGFGSCLQWLNSVTEESIKDYQTFLSTFEIQPTVKAINTTPPIPKKVNKDELEEDDDDSYIVSEDIDSDYNSDTENEPIKLNTDNFLEEGIQSKLSSSNYLLTFRK